MTAHKVLTLSALGLQDRLEAGAAPAPVRLQIIANLRAGLNSLGFQIRRQIEQYLAARKRRVRDVQAHIGLIQVATVQKRHIMPANATPVAHRERSMLYYFLANDFMLKILGCFQSVNAKVRLSEWDFGQIGKPHKEIQHGRSLDSNLV